MYIKANLGKDGMLFIGRLQESTGLELKDLLNNALTLLKWVIEERGAGRKIGSLDQAKKTFRELELPGLDRTKSK